jgi:hypothetical protein
VTKDGDAGTAPASRPPTPAERRWAVVRVVLGTAQVMAATVSAYLLLRTGTNEWSVGALIVTALLVAMSKWLFRGS